MGLAGDQAAHTAMAAERHKADKADTLAADDRKVAFSADHAAETGLRLAKLIAGCGSFPHWGAGSDSWQR